MSSSQAVLAKPNERALARVLARAADYLELTKPRIVVLELIVASGAACVATPHSLNMPALLIALVGTALVAASASAANQLLEIKRDARMPRTANRPLPAGRIAPWEALLVSLVTLLAGTVTLFWWVNPLTTALGLASWILYVAIYTPLKSRSHANTAVGAVAGAIPLLMGWTATGAPLNLVAWSMAGVLFLWQFPHFMAIAWLYRRDYALAGYQMLSTVDPTGFRPGAQAVLGAAMLVPVSLIPVTLPTSGSPLFFLTWVFGLGAFQTGLAIRFAWLRDELSARYLLRASLLYLPIWLALLLVVTL